MYHHPFSPIPIDPPQQTVARAGNTVEVTTRQHFTDPYPGVVVHESQTDTPSTFVAAEERGIPHVRMHKTAKAVTPLERAEIRSEGYVRGADLFLESPRDESAMQQPRKTHGHLEKLTGHVDILTAKLLRNPLKLARGEEKIGRGTAEVDMAKEYAALVTAGVVPASTVLAPRPPPPPPGLL